MIKLPDIYKQSPMLCGPTSLRMVLNYYGIQKTEEELAVLTGATRENGTEPQNIVRVAKELSLSAEYKRESSIEELRQLVEQGIPVIVDWFSPEQNGHYSVIIGVDEAEVVMAEPLFGTERRMKIEDFLNRWFELDNYPPQDPANFTLREIIVIRK